MPETNQPSSPPHDRGRDGPQSLAGDPTSTRCRSSAVFRRLASDVTPLVPINIGLVTQELGQAMNEANGFPCGCERREARQGTEW